MATNNAINNDLSSCSNLPVPSGLDATGTPSASTFLRGDGTWSAPSVTGYRLLGRQIITATGAGTYTPTAGTTAILVECWGAGGGGGGAGWSAGFMSAAGGGGGGGYCNRYYTTLPTFLNYVVGAGGAGGAAGNNNGSGGNNTSFSDKFSDPTNWIAIRGGSAGNGSAGAASGTFTQTYAATGGGLLGLSGTTNQISMQGGMSIRGLTVTGLAMGGAGGNAAMGGGGGAGSGNASGGQSGGGAAGNVPGGGGGGGGSGTAATAGGNGANGMIIIWEYTN